MSSSTAATASASSQSPGPAPRRRPLRALLTSAAMILALMTVGWGAVTLTGQLFRSSDHVSGSYSQVREVRIDTSFEAVEVVGSTSATHVTVERDWSYSLRRPETSIVQAGPALTVASKCPFTPGPECRGTVKVVVPGDLELSLATGDGRLKVRGVTGPVKAATDNGDVAAADLAGTFTVTTTDGSIAATGLRAPEVTATTSDGAVRLAFVRAPSSVATRSRDGNVQIELPADGNPYAVSAKTADGTQTVSVPTRPRLTPPRRGPDRRRSNPDHPRPMSPAS